MIPAVGWGMAELDDLLREVLTATTDEARGAASARISKVDNVVAEINARLRADDWPTREIALHFVTRLAPPPAELAEGVLHCLRSPLQGDMQLAELALVLYACGQLAREV